MSAAQQNQPAPASEPEAKAESKAAAANDGAQDPQGTAGESTDADVAQSGLINHERRRELRERPVGGSAVIKGIPYEVFDWSSSGVCLEGYDGELDIGDRIDSQVLIEIPEQKFDFKCDLIVVRRDTARKLIAGVFVGLPRHDRVTIASHFEALERDANESLRAAITEKK